MDPKVLKIVLNSGEHHDYINKKTGESFIHTVARHHRVPCEKKKGHGSIDGAYSRNGRAAVRSFKIGNVNFPDPDHKNRDGMTVGKGDTALSNVLVQRLGASWTVSLNGRSVYDLTKDKTMLENICSWNNTYWLCSNSFETGKEGDVCMVCCEALDVPYKVYLMECCGALIHV